MSSLCQPTRESLSAYIDGELPPDRSREIADHLATCASCSAEYNELLETVAAVRSQLERFEAPDVLRARIRAAIATTPSEMAAEQAATRHVHRASWRKTWVASLAAAVVIGAALGGGAMRLATGVARNGGTVASEVLASHVRSLMPEHLTDVRSSDQHNVKPWFNGRLDYSPTVPRFDDQGFPLLGGRVDYVAGRPVAVVVYGRRQHIINVFSWPTNAGDAAVTTSTAKGYNMFSWRSHGIEHWVVSDVNAAELRGFAGLLQRADSA